METVSWIDVETGGLNHNEDPLLQVACLVTDTQFNILDDAGYDSVVYFDAMKAGIYKAMLAEKNPYVFNMHTSNGLLDMLPSGKPLLQIDVELHEYLTRFSEPKKSLLGGNSITLDRNFLSINLPKSFNHLSYQSVDVTSIAKVMEWKYGEKARMEKKLTHNAFDDIRESIEQMKFLSNMM